MKVYLLLGLLILLGFLTGVIFVELTVINIQATVNVPCEVKSAVKSTVWLGPNMNAYDYATTLVFCKDGREFFTNDKTGHPDWQELKGADKLQHIPWVAIEHDNINKTATSQPGLPYIPAYNSAVHG